MASLHSSKGKLAALTLLAVLALLSTPGRRSRVRAFSTVQRTFVSGLGTDLNPCSRTSPCRTFAQAMSQTNPGGEVIVLDSAGYGAFSITQAVSIVAPPGVYAGISVFSGDGIDINVPTGTVILRGLTVNNQGSSGSGIVFQAGETLYIENCVVNGFGGFGSAGVFIKSFCHLEVKDSTMRGDETGILVAPTPFAASATIEHVRLEGGAYGLQVQDGSTVYVRDSIATSNFNGFQAQSNSGASAELNVENCGVSNNFNLGIQAQSNSTGVATVRVSNSTVTDNVYGLVNAGFLSVFLSRGNNTVEGNSSSNKLGTIGSYTAK